MDLSIIIVNWNSKEYLRKCVGSILAETRGLEFEIIVIDSASFDGCAELLQKEFPEVRFIQSPENLGFSRANNLAFKSTSGKSVLFLNPDTEIIGPSVNALYSALQTLSNAGAVGAKLLNVDGTVQTSCIQAFPTILNQLLSSELLRRCFPRLSIWGMAPLFEGQAEPKVVEAISGACVMLPRALLERVGVFSEDYFMYAEDIDLSYKIGKVGYKCYYVPEATVVHLGGGSSGAAISNFSSIMTRESVWRFLRKTRGGFYGYAYRMSTLVSALIHIGLLIVLRLLKPGGQARATWLASFQKWRAILSWSLRREKWVENQLKC